MPGCSRPAGDLRLDDESLAAVRVVGVTVEDLLECHLAIELGIECHEHSAETAAGVRPQDAEPLAVGGGRAAGARRCGRDRRRTGRPSRPVEGEGGVKIAIAEPGQAFTGGRGGDGRQALLGVSTVLLDVPDHRRDPARWSLRGRRGPPGDRRGDGPCRIQA